MTTLDPAYCADGCGRLAETERAYGDGNGGLEVELVCRPCLGPSYERWSTDQAPGEHSSNPREDG